MNVHGIVAEYNPFHKGHKYLINECRAQGATHVVVVMSGNYVQRGEPAILDKWTRAKAALVGGADLVLELPLVWSLSSAEGFARGAVEIINALGCVETLSFGSESSDLASLQLLANAAVSTETIESTKKYLKQKISYPSARQKAIEETCGQQIASFLNNPNDILGVEYIKALNLIKSNITPNPIKRIGPSHDAPDEQKNFLSASQIRKQIDFGEYSCFEFIPPEVESILNAQIALGKAPVRIAKIETSILSKLRVMTIEEIKEAPDVSEGLENRIASCVKSARTLDELYEKIKTKRYTHSRIRRIIMSSFLNIRAEDSKKSPPYLKVLGFNEKGQELLRQAKQKATLPIIMKPVQIKELDAYAQRIFELECASTDIYTLAMPTPLPCGMEMTENVVRI
ncbi:MAG: nucleotidyltransferase [Oscillospiraceae bacterium]